MHCSLKLSSLFLFWQLLQQVSSIWKWADFSGRSCRPRARRGSTEAWRLTSSRSSPPSASAMWFTSSWRCSWGWRRAEIQSHDFQRLNATSDPSPHNSCLYHPSKDYNVKGIPGAIGAPPWVHGVVSFCECRLRKDERTLNVGPTERGRIGLWAHGLMTMTAANYV